MNTMRIEGISLSQFNDEAGLKLIMTVPQFSILTQQQFTLCSDFILPCYQLCQKIIAIQYKKDYFLLGMPSLSVNKPNNKVYHREKYIYSVSILIKKQDYLLLIAKQNLYMEIIRKLAYYFKFLEQSYHYIYNHTAATQYLQKLLRKIFNDINQQKRCFLNHLCSHYTFINLNYSPIRQQLVNNLNLDIKDCQIPITNLTSDQIQNYVQSQVGQKLLRYAYQGEYTIKKICQMNKEIKQLEIKMFYKKALEKGLVFMMDMFSLDNIYVLTQKIHEYIGDSQKSTVFSLIKNSVTLQQKIGQPESLDESIILFLYCEFNRLMKLSKIVAQHKSLFLKINVIKFVRLGVILRILKRVHHHALYFQTCPILSNEQFKRYLKKKLSIDFTNQKNQKILEEQKRRMHDLLGGHLMNNDSMDQICCSLEMDHETFLKMVSPQKRYIFAFPQ